jgi:hypothetical protein
VAELGLRKGNEGRGLHTYLILIKNYGSTKHYSDACRSLQEHEHRVEELRFDTNTIHHFFEQFIPNFWQIPQLFVILQRQMMEQ